MCPKSNRKSPRTLENATFSLLRVSTTYTKMLSMSCLDTVSHCEIQLLFSRHNIHSLMSALTLTLSESEVVLNVMQVLAKIINLLAEDGPPQQVTTIYQLVSGHLISYL